VSAFRIARQDGVRKVTRIENEANLQSNGVDDLPPELILEILSHLDPQDPDYHTTLLSCSLLCRSFSDGSRPLLFSTVVLRPLALEDLSIFLFNPQTDDLPNPDIFPCKIFYLLCLENPSLCTYVKELIVDASMFVGWDSLLIITSDLCNLRTVTIRALISSQAVEDSIPSALIAGLQTTLAIPSVSSLQLQECNFHSASIPRFLYQILAP
jgi:hypothetical protein